MNDETLGVVAVRAAHRRGWTCEQIRAMLIRLQDWPYYDLDAPPSSPIGGGWTFTARLNANVQWPESV